MTKSWSGSSSTKVLIVCISVASVWSKQVVKECNKAIDFENPKVTESWKVQLPLTEGKCLFTVLGTDQCEPMVSCNVDIPGSQGNCDDDIVKITDGASGETVVCGQNQVSAKASKGLRDLFVRVQTKGKSGSVSCTAKCVKGDKLRLEANIKKKPDTRCACGFQNKDDRIVGGEDAKMAEFPWQAALVFPGTRSPFCGGTIINDKFILTAAHCFWFENKQPKELEVLLHALLLDMTKVENAKDVELGKEGSIRGSHYNAAKATDKSEKTLRLEVQEIINHPLFDDVYDYDYALLKLKKKVSLVESDSPTPICLPPANTWDSLMAGQVGKMFTVVGWGKSHEDAGASTRMLQKLDLPMMPWEECVEKVPADVLTRRMICAGFEKGEKDACTGDSGGALIYQQTKKQYWQFGVVSWGEGCAREGKPGLYSRVTEAMQWVNFHCNEAEAKWCSGPKPLGQ